MQYSSLIDGILLDRLDDEQAGLYLCFGRLPRNERWFTAVYPVMLILSDDDDDAERQSD